MSWVVFTLNCLGGWHTSKTLVCLWSSMSTSVAFGNYRNGTCIVEIKMLICHKQLTCHMLLSGVLGQAEARLSLLAWQVSESLGHVGAIASVASLVYLLTPMTRKGHHLVMNSHPENPTYKMLISWAQEGNMLLHTQERGIAWWWIVTLKIPSSKC